jgi:hypothetical protein
MFHTPAATARTLRRIVIIFALALLFAQGADTVLRFTVPIVRDFFPAVPPWPGLNSMLSEFGLWSYGALAWALPLAAAGLFLLERYLDRGIRVTGSGAHPIEHRPEAYETAIRGTIRRGFEGRVSPNVSVSAGQASRGVRLRVRVKVRDGERGPALQDELHRAVIAKLEEMTGASAGHEVAIVVDGVISGGDGRLRKQGSGRKGLPRNPASTVEP